MNLDLAELIRELKGPRTFEELAADCGDTPSVNRLYSMTQTQLKTFPTPDSIRGLARGLRTTPERVVTSCGISLGLIPREQGAAPMLLPETARHLTDSQRSLLIGLVHEFTAANRTAGLIPTVE